MSKINFRKITVVNIKGEEEIADIQEKLGSQLFFGREMEEYELGKKIYHAQGEVELNEKEEDLVRKAIEGYSYVLRIAIKDALK